MIRSCPTQRVFRSEGETLRTIFSVIWLCSVVSVLAFAQSSPQQPTQPVRLGESLQDPRQLAGKNVIVQRTAALCEPGTYNLVFTYVGKPAKVLSVQPSTDISESTLSKLPPAARATLENRATLLLQFEDGKKLDTCAPVGPSRLGSYFQLAEGETLGEVPSRGASPVVAETNESTPDHLSPDEVKAALTGKPGTGTAVLEDMGFGATANCQVQTPTLYLYTPTGWLQSLSVGSRKQYLPFNPAPQDTLRALTIIAKGCANGTAAGPVCDSITRVALLSDKAGTVVAEAIGSDPLPQSWQNGFGAHAACTSLVTRFAMSDVEKVRNAKGEFLVATFGGGQLLKIYTIKQKYIRQLGL